MALRRAAWRRRVRGGCRGDGAAHGDPPNAVSPANDAARSGAARGGAGRVAQARLAQSRAAPSSETHRGRGAGGCPGPAGGDPAGRPGRRERDGSDRPRGIRPEASWARSGTPWGCWQRVPGLDLPFGVSGVPGAGARTSAAKRSAATAKRGLAAAARGLAARRSAVRDELGCRRRVPGGGGGPAGAAAGGVARRGRAHGGQRRVWLQRAPARHGVPEARRVIPGALLTPLLAYDRDHGTELVSTLQVFLACSGSWSKAAEAMFIHVNSLRYRIRRIQELTGRDRALPGRPGGPAAAVLDQGLARANRAARLAEDEGAHPIRGAAQAGDLPCGEQRDSGRGWPLEGAPGRQLGDGRRAPAARTLLASGERVVEPGSLSDQRRPRPARPSVVSSAEQAQPGEPAVRWISSRTCVAGTRPARVVQESRRVSEAASGVGGSVGNHRPAPRPVAAAL